MIKNYFKIAWRNLLKYRFISFINLFGLTVGITCCLLILAYILNETSYDRYNEKADRIYRVTRSFNNADGVVSLHLGTVAPPFGPLLQSQFPDIEKMTRMLQNGSTLLKYKEKNFNEKNVFFADENMMDVFTVQMVKGNGKNALNDPFSIMLTEELAQKYFGNENPIDKSIRLNNQFECKVTGVFKAFPNNAHIHPEIMVSFNTLKDPAIYGEEGLRTNFGNNSFLTYILLPKNYPAASMQAKFPNFLDTRVHLGGTPSTFKTSTSTKLFLQKLTDIHLHSHLDFEAEENGDIKRVYIFSAIALFILLIACINYMNLSTARSALRAREIGVRKAIGADKKELVIQFLSESVIVAWAASLLALLLTLLALPWLNKMSGQELSLNILLQAKVLVAILLVPFVVGILSGIYPAVFMSSFQPVKVLKGTFKIGGSSISFRKALVITQFGISIILIICTAVVFQQLHFMRNANPGYSKEHIITINYPQQITKNYESFRNELLQNSGIKDAARSSRIPTGRLLDNAGASSISGDSLVPVTSDIKYVVTDPDFVPTYDIRMKAGRNFSRAYGTDTAGFIVNEATVKMIGWKDNAKAVGTAFSYGAVRGRIIGVMDGFHFESMHQKIVPIILLLPAANDGGSYNQLSIKIAGKNLPGEIAAIEKIFKKFDPETPFNYTFLDERFNQLYAAEQKQASLFTTFACIAILIACLGLFGLSAFAISQRIKEIGIRKVLGASTNSIVKLLSRDFFILVIVAALIAFPIAWYAMHNWLQNFAYRIDIAWWIFVLSAIIAGAVALATVSFQALKASLSNPVKNLRTE
jgi:putative ABC transport system permease protein